MQYSIYQRVTYIKKKTTSFFLDNSIDHIDTSLLHMRWINNKRVFRAFFLRKKFLKCTYPG